jgi:fructose/tagatose bisphosphate aldolase
MPLISMRQLLDHAAEHGYGVRTNARDDGSGCRNQ